MALAERRHGALYVLEQTGDADWYNRRLKAINEDLFVEKQITFDNEQVWCVCWNRGERADPPIMVIHEHRDRHGVPIGHLTDGLVDAVAQMFRDGPRSVKSITEANERIHRRREAEAREHRAEINREFERMQRRSGALPRSQKLAVGKRKARRLKERRPGWMNEELPRDGG